MARSYLTCVAASLAMVSDPEIRYRAASMEFRFGDFDYIPFSKIRSDPSSPSVQSPADPASRNCDMFRNGNDDGNYIPVLLIMNCCYAYQECQEMQFKGDCRMSYVTAGRNIADMCFKFKNNANLFYELARSNRFAIAFLSCQECHPLRLRPMVVDTGSCIKTKSYPRKNISIFYMFICYFGMVGF